MFYPHKISRLRRRRTVGLHVPAGTTLTVARGTGWLTSDAHPSDVVLRAGGEYTARRPEHLVLEALEQTIVYALRRPGELGA